MTFNQRFHYAALTSALAILFHINAPAQSDDRSNTIKELTALRKELIEKQKQFIAPSAEDQTAHAEFLKQPDTGLFRLFPNGLYEDTLRLFAPGEPYRITHATFKPVRDISLSLAQPDNIAAPPIADYLFQVGGWGGYMASLGDVPLENVTLDHKGVKFLDAYNPPSTAARAREEFRPDLEVKKNNYLYQRKALVVVNYTYVIRIINYNQLDMLVAFRVVRKEIDGSLVILWKMLKRFPTPALQ